MWKIGILAGVTTFIILSKKKHLSLNLGCGVIFYISLFSFSYLLFFNFILLPTIAIVFAVAIYWLHSRLYSILYSWLYNRLYGRLYGRLHGRLYNGLYSRLHSRLHSRLYIMEYILWSLKLRTIIWFIDLLKSRKLFTWFCQGQKSGFLYFEAGLARYSQF